ncbi:hypothetical protein RI367_000851 [Sorochytrium milnesiophthora]
MAESVHRISSLFNDSLQFLRPQREDKVLTEGDRAKSAPSPKRLPSSTPSDASSSSGATPSPSASPQPHQENGRQSPRSQPPTASEKMSKMSWRWKWKLDVFGHHHPHHGQHGRHSGSHSESPLPPPPQPLLPQSDSSSLTKTQIGFQPSSSSSPADRPSSPAASIDGSTDHHFPGPSSLASSLATTHSSLADVPVVRHRPTSFDAESALSKSLTERPAELSLHNARRPESPMLMMGDTAARAPHHQRPPAPPTQLSAGPVVAVNTIHHHGFQQERHDTAFASGGVPIPLHLPGARSSPISIPSPTFESALPPLAHAQTCPPAGQDSMQMHSQPSFAPPQEMMDHDAFSIPTASVSPPSAPVHAGTFPRQQKPVRRSASVATVITKRPSIKRQAGLRRTSSITPPSSTNPAYWLPSSAVALPSSLNTPNSAAASFLAQFNGGSSQSLPASPDGNKAAVLTDAFGNVIQPLPQALPLQRHCYTMPVSSSPAMQTALPAFSPPVAGSSSLGNASSMSTSSIAMPMQLDIALRSPSATSNISSPAATFLTQFSSALPISDSVSVNTHESASSSLLRDTLRTRTLTDTSIAFDSRTSRSEVGSSRDENECWSGFWESGFMVEEGDEIEGGYVVGKPLGTGTFSSVHVATCQQSGRKYALKVVVDKSKVPASGSMTSSLTLEPIHEAPPHREGRGSNSFKCSHHSGGHLSPSIEHEITLWQTLHHPNILELVDVVVAPECLFVFCELMEDGNLLQVVSEWDRIRAVDGLWQVSQLIPEVPAERISPAKIYPATLLACHSPVVSLSSVLCPLPSSAPLSAASALSSNQYSPLSAALAQTDMGGPLGMAPESKLEAGLPEYLTARIGSQLAAALNYMHNTAGIVHRDIKLENILVRFRHRTGYAYFLSCEGPVGSAGAQAAVQPVRRAHIRSATSPAKSSNLAMSTRFPAVTGGALKKPTKQTEIPEALVPHLLRMGFKERRGSLSPASSAAALPLAAGSAVVQEAYPDSASPQLSASPTNAWTIELDGQVYLLRREICRRIIDIEAKLADFGLSEFLDVAVDKFCGKSERSASVPALPVGTPSMPNSGGGGGGGGDDKDDHAGAGSLEYCPPEYFARPMTLSRIVSAFRSLSPSLPSPSPSAAVMCAQNASDRDIARRYLCAADIWALGVVLYAAVCAQMPFADDFEPRLVKKIRDGKWDAENHFSAFTDGEWSHLTNEQHAWAVEAVRACVSVHSNLKNHDRCRTDSSVRTDDSGERDLNMSFELLPTPPPSSERQPPAPATKQHPQVAALNMSAVDQTRLTSSPLPLSPTNTISADSVELAIAGVDILQSIPLPTSLLHHLPHDGRVSPYFMSLLRRLLCVDWRVRLTSTEVSQDAWLRL